MASLLTTAINKLTDAARASATTMQPPAPASAAPQIPDLTAITDTEELKRQVAGSMWEFNGAQAAAGTYGFTPLGRPVQIEGLRMPCVLLQTAGDQDGLVFRSWRQARAAPIS